MTDADGREAGGREAGGRDADGRDADGRDADGRDADGRETDDAVAVTPAADRTAEPSGAGGDVVPTGEAGPARPVPRLGALRAGQFAPRNRWDHLEVPELGAWEPNLTVSVVVPYYQARDELEVTLAALAEQTYPSHLTQVVVADDGSTPPLELAERHRGLEVTVVRQEDLGFRLAAVRNLGAEAADGEVLVFLDGDMVAEPSHLEAHARWHHVCDHAVTLGFRRHIEFDGVGPDEVAEAARAGSLARLFAGRDTRQPAWLERHMTRMAELTSDDDDLFRAVTGGNLAMRTEVFTEVGGFDASFTQWGSEDTEIGQRLFTAGALLVPERAAACWHQGDSQGLEDHERESLADQRARISQLVPHPQFRRLARGRGFEVPRVVVEVLAGDAEHPTITATVESVLASELPDLEVLLRVDDDHPRRVRIGWEWAGDPRVVFDDRGVHARVPYRLTLPAGASLAPDSLDAVVWQLSNPRDAIGVLRLTLPDEPPSSRSALAVTTRAVSRARRVVGGGRWAAPVGEAGGAGGAGGTDADSDTGREHHGGADGADGTDVEVLACAGELFGERWLSGTALGLVWAPVAELEGIARRRVRPRIPPVATGTPDDPGGDPAASGEPAVGGEPAAGDDPAVGGPAPAGSTVTAPLTRTDKPRGSVPRRLLLRLRRVAVTTLPPPAVEQLRRVKHRLRR